MMTLDQLNTLLDAFPKPEKVFDKDGNEVKETPFRLPMSQAAVDMALSHDWAHRVIYRRDTKTNNLIPEVVFDLPEAQKG